MTVGYPIPTEIFHITSYYNIVSILNNDGLLSNSVCYEKGICFENIAHSSIQNRRELKRIPVFPNGNLHDYVPFYFAPKSPMLYSIHKGNV